MIFYRTPNYGFLQKLSAKPDFLAIMKINNTLVRIKRAILKGNYAFSLKASLELEADGLSELDIAESIINAVAIYKTIRSNHPF